MVFLPALKRHGEGEKRGRGASSPCPRVSPSPRLLFGLSRLPRYVDQHFRARLDLQLLASLHGQRTSAAGAAHDQTDRCAFAATGDAADDRTYPGANAASLDRLIGPASRLDATFVICFSGIIAIHTRHIAMQHALATITQLDPIEGEIHTGPAFNLAGFLKRANASKNSRFVETIRIQHSRRKTIADA